MLYAVGRCRAVSHDKTSRAEIHASVISYHDYQNVGKVVGKYLSEYRFACRAAWLSVIVGLEVGFLRSQHVGIAYVASIVVFLSVFLHNLLHLVSGTDVMCKSEEFATLFAVESLACLFCYCLICIFQIYFLLSEFMNNES